MQAKKIDQKGYLVTGAGSVETVPSMPDLGIVLLDSRSAWVVRDGDICPWDVRAGGASGAPIAVHWKPIPFLCWTRVSPGGDAVLLHCGDTSAAPYKYKLRILYPAAGRVVDLKVPAPRFRMMKGLRTLGEDFIQSEFQPEPQAEQFLWVPPACLTP